MNPRLSQVYRRTIYKVGNIRFRIGHRSAALDAILRKGGVREAVLIGADNPFSRRMPAGWNQRMRARMAERLRRRLALPASGTLRGWSEHHFFVLGSVRYGRRLAKSARQNGIVIIRLGQPPRLCATSTCAGSREVCQVSRSAIKDNNRIETMA